MQLDWIEAASEELMDALDWYQDQAPEQVERLTSEVVEAERLIGQLPKAWHPIVQDIRAFRLNKFPYSIVYRDTKPIRVIAFMHQHRRPGYWAGRVN